MAKLYDFRLIVRQAEFYERGGAAIVYGGPSTVFHECAEQLTFAAAQQRLRELSAAESRPHAAMLSMKCRADRVPPGFNDHKKTCVYGGEGSK
jgi:hypothetical protein